MKAAVFNASEERVAHIQNIEMSHKVGLIHQRMPVVMKVKSFARHRVVVRIVVDTFRHEVFLARASSKEPITKFPAW